MGSGDWAEARNFSRWIRITVKRSRTGGGPGDAARAGAVVARAGGAVTRGRGCSRPPFTADRDDMQSSRRIGLTKLMHCCSPTAG